MSQEEYFGLVKALADDLNSGNVRLPSFPDVVMRIRAALDEPETTSEDMANILHTDAALASRMLVFANSSYHNPAGVRIEGLHAAISRVGFEQVRTAAISYALQQLHSAPELAPLKEALRKSWSSGLNLGALSESIAKHCTPLDPDSAFVAGLLHNVGVLYIFSKYRDYPTLLKDPDTRQSLIDDWAPPIGESIVANWDFDEEIQRTLNPDAGEQERYRGKARLADVVITAKRSLAGEDLNWTDSAEAKRLGLTPQLMTDVIESYEQRIASLTAALG